MGFKETPLRCIGRLQAIANIPAFLRDPVGHLAQLNRQYGDCFLYPFGGVSSTLVVTCPETANEVLKSKEFAFGKSDIQTRFMQQFLGPGLLTMHGEPWRQQRRTIAGGFQPRRMVLHSEAMHQTIDTGLDALEIKARKGAVRVAPEITSVAFSLVTRMLMGSAVTAKEISTISSAISEIQAFVVRCIVMPWADKFYRSTGVYAWKQAVRAAGDAIISDLIAVRMQEDEGADHVPDMLDILSRADHPSTGKPLTRQELVAEIMQLLVAGHETSSTVLSWALWLLAINPETQARAHAEIVSVLRDRHLTIADVAKLPLCTGILKEAMRLYPPFWLVDRVALEDCTVGGISVSRGTRIAIFIYGLHRHPGLWKEPEEFDPQRFMGQERSNERTGGYLPFGSGSRTCVGSSFAMWQMLMILSAMLRRWEVMPTALEVQTSAMLILRASNGIPVHLKSRR